MVDEDEEFATDTKFVAQFWDIFRGGEIHFQHSIGLVHSSNILHYAPLLHTNEFGGDGTFHGCKVIVKDYVAKVIESLEQQFQI